MLAGAHKKLYRVQHAEIYLLDLKVQYKDEMKLPLGMIIEHVFLYLCLPDYYSKSDFNGLECNTMKLTSIYSLETNLHQAGKIHNLYQLVVFLAGVCR